MVGIQVHSISPIGGPAEGGTRVAVSVRGGAFTTEPAACIFGNTVASGTVHSRDLISCVSPACAPPCSVGPVSFEVKCNETTSRSHRMFTYVHVNSAVLNALSPFGGPRYGGTEVSLSLNLAAVEMSALGLSVNRKATVDGTKLKNCVKCYRYAERRLKSRPY